MHDIYEIKIRKNPEKEIGRLLVALESNKEIVVDEVPNIRGESDCDVFAKKERENYFIRNGYESDGAKWIKTDHNEILKLIYRKAWSMPIHKFKSGYAILDGD